MLEHFHHSKTRCQNHLQSKLIQWHMAKPTLYKNIMVKKKNLRYKISIKLIQIHKQRTNY